MDSERSLIWKESTKVARELKLKEWFWDEKFKLVLGWDWLRSGAAAEDVVVVAPFPRFRRLWNTKNQLLLAFHIWRLIEGRDLDFLKFFAMSSELGRSALALAAILQSLSSFSFFSSPSAAEKELQTQGVFLQGLYKPLVLNERILVQFKWNQKLLL